VINSPHTYGCSNRCGIFRFLRIQRMVNISFMSTKLHEKIRHQTSIHIHYNVSHNEANILFHKNINILQDFWPSRLCWWRFKHSALLCCTDWYVVTDISKEFWGVASPLCVNTEYKEWVKVKHNYIIIIICSYVVEGS